MAKTQTGYEIEKVRGICMVIDPTGRLACITVHKKGALEVVRRLAAQRT